MLNSIIAALLPTLVFFGNSANLFVETVGTTRTANAGTLEKLAVADATIVFEIDVENFRLGGVAAPRLTFAAAPDSFFTFLVYNGELRAVMPGTLTLVPSDAGMKGRLPDLVLERSELVSDDPLVIRDRGTGSIVFNVDAAPSNFDGFSRTFRSQGGRLVLTKEYADALGRPEDAGKIVGQFAMSASTRVIESIQVSDGEVKAASLPANRNPEPGTVPGPDVVVGRLFDLSQWGSNATHVGLAVGTDSCNFGTVDLNWFALPNNDHPVIPQNLYRMSGGTNNEERFEMIGFSQVKHAFTALTQNICGLGCNGVGGSRLGSGCSDPYSADLNEGPNLGSRAWINPFTGFYPRGDSATPPNTHTGHNHTGPAHRIITKIDDLNTSMNAGAKYYVEAQYITPHEYAHCQSNPGQCNMYNNVSYRRYTVNGTTGPFTFSTVTGEDTVQMQPAVNAWPGATRVEIRPDPGNDGIGTLAYKVTQTGPSTWHYEYAVYNMNLDRAIRFFSVPRGSGATITNAGFYAPPQHPGYTFDGTASNAGYSAAPWTATIAAGGISWETETLAQNPNANAIRWGTMYNFRFDSNQPPSTALATVGFYKTGDPITVQVQAPGGVAANVFVSGRVTTSIGRGIGYAKVVITGPSNFTRTVYTNSFGFFRINNVPTGALYTINVTAWRYTFASQQIQVNDNVSNANFTGVPNFN